MRFGICASPKDAAAVKRGGFDFLEINVQSDLDPRLADAAVKERLALIASCGLPPLAANCFIPQELKLTGPDADPAALDRYSGIAMERAERAGIRTIVLGSGASRRVPEGFDRERAWSQLVAFGRRVGPLAEKHGVTVVVEPLGRKETNILNTLDEAGRLMTDIGHPSVRLILDSYHWMTENDSPADIIRWSGEIRHVHIATLAGRLPPGTEECDFSTFVSSLRKSKYDHPVSIEASWTDISRQSIPALIALKTLFTT